MSPRENAKNRRREIRQKQYNEVIREIIDVYRQYLSKEKDLSSYATYSNSNKKYKLVFIVAINSWAIAYEDNSCTILTEGTPHWTIFNENDYNIPDFNNLHESERNHLQNQLERAYEVMSS